MVLIFDPFGRCVPIFFWYAGLAAEAMAIESV